MVCDPSERPTGVNDHAPLASAVAVPRRAEPSVRVTTAPGSPRPVRRASNVMWSVADTPVSLTKLSVTVGGAITGGAGVPAEGGGVVADGGGEFAKRMSRPATRVPGET